MTHNSWREAAEYQFLVFGRDLTLAAAKATVASWLGKQCNLGHWCLSSVVKLGGTGADTLKFGPEITILRVI